MKKGSISILLKRLGLLGGGGAAIGIYRYKDGIDKCTDIEISLYKNMSLRTLSRITGSIASIQFPPPLNYYVNKTYVNIFGVRLDEAEPDDPGQYNSLSQLFTRSLKPGIRNIDLSHELVSPVDGTVITADINCSNRLPQIKGLTYSLRAFLGDEDHKDDKSADDYRHSLLKYPDKNVLHQIVIYLAPKDYHRFHSPCSWTVKLRRHFSGKLLSVNPSVASVVSDLFTVNERVVYVGEWKYGFFSYAAVGATNVGSITVFRDDGLRTNEKKPAGREEVVDLSWKLKPGDPFGQFNMGSTIVLIFEAPPGFKFNCDKGSTLKMGGALGTTKAK